MLLLFLVWIMLVPSLAHAATYYVAVTGNNSNSCATAQSPGGSAKRTINAGIGCLASGDTLIVQDGTYNEVFNSNIPSGTTNTHTIVKSQNQYGAVIQPTSVSSGYLGLYIFGFASQSYITIDGFVVDSTNVTGSFGPSDTMGAFCLCGTSHHITVKNSDIRNINPPNIPVGEGNAFAFNGASSTNFTIADNKIHHIGSGYALYCSSPNTIIERNEIYNIGTAGQSFTGYPIHCFNVATGDAPNYASGVIVRNNRIHDNTSTILLASRGSNQEFYNNLVYQNTGAGIQAGYFGSPAANLRIVNNTFFGNSGACLDAGGAASGWLFQNNICFNNGANSVIGPGAASVTQVTNLLGTNPSFVDTANDNFHLQSDSPARDSGTCHSLVTQDLDGNARQTPCDIGAFEFGSGGPPPVGTLGTFYIATTGLDTRTCIEAQSISTPKRTFASALPCGLGGSVFYVRAGTYIETIDDRVVTLNSGPSVGSPTLIAAYQGETVTLAPAVDSSTPIIYVGTGKQYITFQGFIVDGGGQAANGYILEGTTGIKILGGTVKSFVWAPVLFRGGVNPEVSGVTVQDHINEHCIYLNNAVSGATIRGNIIQDCRGAGIYAVADDYPTSTNTNLVISGNIVRNAHVGATEAAIVVGHGSNPTVANNLIYSNPKGIRVDDSTTSAKLYHNTAYSNTGVGIQVDATASGTAITNNILFLNGSTISDSGAGTSMTTNLSSNPTFADAGNGDFSISQGSAACNSGTILPAVATDFRGTGRPQGPTSDIGAYECFEVPPPPAPPNNLRIPLRQLYGFMPLR